MDSPVQVPATETTPFWTQEKHVHFLNSMEASFVRTMLDSNHHHLHLRLDRHLPDSSESTVDSKPHRRRTRKHHAPSEMGRKARRTKRRSSSSCNSSQDQVVPRVQIEREDAACNSDDGGGGSSSSSSSREFK